MNFYAPTSVDEALGILARDEEARCLSGGQTLVAMMNADLVRPSALVSLHHIGELHGIRRQPDGSVTIGATTTHAEIADSDLLSDAQAILTLAARRIAHPAIRNAGTIGGSIAHADPAADFPTAITAADAEVEIAGPQARRRVPAHGFFTDYLTTQLAPGEIVAAIHCPKGPLGAVAAYEKLTRVDGDFAIVSAAVVLAFDGDRCCHARIAVGACGPTPIRAAAAEALLLGTSVGDAQIEAAAAVLLRLADPTDDFRGSAAYRLKILPRLVKRAIQAALARRP